jgi:hypothetical protein
MDNEDEEVLQDFGVGNATFDRNAQALYIRDDCTTFLSVALITVVAS